MIWIEGQEVRDGVYCYELYCDCCDAGWAEPEIPQKCPKCGADR